MIGSSSRRCGSARACAGTSDCKLLTRSCSGVRPIVKREWIARARGYGEPRTEGARSRVGLGCSRKAGGCGSGWTHRDVGSRHLEPLLESRHPRRSLIPKNPTTGEPQGKLRVTRGPSGGSAGGRGVSLRPVHSSTRRRYPSAASGGVHRRTTGPHRRTTPQDNNNNVNSYKPTPS